MERDTGTTLVTSHRSGSPRRRRYALGTAIVAGAAAVVTVSVTLLHRAPAGPPDARAAGLALVAGDTLYLTDGSHVTLPVPAGGSVGSLEVVPAGYLYDVWSPGAGPDSLRLAVPDSAGAYLDLGVLADSQYHVSPDGRTAVVTAIDAKQRSVVQAIDLATGKRLTNSTLDSPEIVDVGGDWALLRDDNSPNADVRATELWDIRTGAVVAGADPTFTEYGVLASGAVLRGMHVPPLNEPVGPLTPCYAVVALTDFGSTAPTGYCGPQEIGEAWLSPGGDWALVMDTVDPPELGDQLALIRVADLEAGRWAPLTVNTDDFNAGIFWDSPTTFVIPGDGGAERCTTAGTCTSLHISRDTVIGQTLGA